MIPFPATKANTLEWLCPQVTSCRILPQATLTVGELAESPSYFQERALALSADSYIVRSSALCEDSAEASHAGEFLSVANVPPEELLAAAQRVAASFPDGNSQNQILIQPMLTGITMSGVLFTLDPNTGGNYLVINYDRSDSADSVTSGEGKELEVCYLFHGRQPEDSRFLALSQMAEELIEQMERPNLDIEFAFCGEKLYLLQARPLVMPVGIADGQMQREALERVDGFLRREMQPKPNIPGRRTIYGVMPDWNPAEMIGIRPKPLALSLYKRLITDGIWAYQRSNYGYQNLRSFPLMMDFCGLPYIDTRVSFNSFIPRSLQKRIAAKLADYYLDRLAACPEKHDKVEMEIIFSCYTFDLPQKLETLEAHGFSDSERQQIAASLLEVTNRIISTQNGLWMGDLARIDRLVERHRQVMDSPMDTVSKIYWLLEDCARYGTLPFAGLARAGFIAVLLLQSLVSIGILTAEEYQRYMAGLETISSQMADDRRELSKGAYLKKYGHLRPGTYDITSPRYDADPDLYWGEEEPFREERKQEPFSLTLEQYQAIQKEMEEQGLVGDVLSLFSFIKAGIEGREYAKFIFTRSLSDALELLAALGEENGFSREEMAYADIALINQLYASSRSPKELLVQSIREGKARHQKTLTLTMPPVLKSPEDIWQFHLPSGQPNFITLGEASGEVCTALDSREALRDKIVVIPAADPGYDWIFSCGIRGLVTAYGGANSHMAIRAGELSIPAVIGVGEKTYAQLRQARGIRMDCANRRLEAQVRERPEEIG